MEKKIYWRGLLKKIGPGFITGAADDDPSGVATYSQTGAAFGYSHLWMPFFSLPFLYAIQQMCGRIGLVTGKGLARIIQSEYPKPVLYFTVSLLVLANTINISADLRAMSDAAQMLVGLPLIFWQCALSVFIVILEIFVSYKTYSRILKYLGLTLFSYVLTAFVIDLDWQEIIRSIISPEIEFTRDYLLNIVAILGTTISPYLFFWQTSQEAEEEVNERKIRDIGIGKPKVRRRNIIEMRVDTIVGMLFSQTVMFFIIITTSATLHVNGITDIQTASQAAEALRPLAGEFAYLLFAIGIIGTGLLAVPILAGASAYAVAEMAGMKEGLSKKPGKAPGFYGVIAASTLLGLIISWVGIDPYKGLYYAAVFNGLAAPPLMVMILLIANNKDIMGKYVNKRISNILGWIIILIMTAAGILLVYDLLIGL